MVVKAGPQAKVKFAKAGSVPKLELPASQLPPPRTSQKEGKCTKVWNTSEPVTPKHLAAKPGGGESTPEGKRGESPSPKGKGSSHSSHKMQW